MLVKSASCRTRTFIAAITMGLLLPLVVWTAPSWAGTVPSAPEISNVEQIGERTYRVTWSESAGTLSYVVRIFSPTSNLLLDVCEVVDTVCTFTATNIEDARVLVVARNASGESVDQRTSRVLIQSGHYSYPLEPTSDSQGNVYVPVANSAGNDPHIEKVTTDGQISRLITVDAQWWPDYVSLAVTPDDQYLYFTDQGQDPFGCGFRLVRVTLATLQQESVSTGLCAPSDVAIDDDGTIVLRSGGRVTSGQWWKFTSEMNLIGATTAAEYDRISLLNRQDMHGTSVRFTGGWGGEYLLVPKVWTIAGGVNLDAPDGVLVSAGSRSVAVSWDSVSPSEDGLVVTYTARTDSGKSCTSTALTCEISGLMSGHAYTVTVTATDGIRASLPSAVTSGAAAGPVADGDYFNITESTYFKAPVAGLYRIQLIGAGGQGGMQCYGWVAGGGGGGGAYVDGSAWVGSHEMVKIDIGQAGAMAGDPCLNGNGGWGVFVDGNAGTESRATLESGSAIIAGGGAGGHGAQDNLGGSGGTYSSAGADFTSVTGYAGGTGGSGIIHPSFSYGWHEGGEGGGAANSGGAGLDGTSVVCSWTAHAQVGDLPAGAGGHGPSGGYGAYVDECQYDPLLLMGQNFGAGGMGCHCKGEAGAPGYVRITLVRAVIPASAPSIGSVLTGNGRVTLGSVTAPAQLNDSELSGYDYSTNNGMTWSHFASVEGPFTISGLTNGTTYQVKMRAVNSAGAGAASTAVSVTPTNLVPSTPIVNGVIAGNQEASISIETPSGVTANSITGIQYSLNNGLIWSACIQPNRTTCRISGLVNGIRAGVKLRHVNANGFSVATPRIYVTPVTTSQSASLTSITPSAGALTVVFSPPSDTGGSKITNYQYSLDGGQTWVTPAKAVTKSPLKITGLANATSYAVKLRPVTAFGIGAVSETLSASTPALVATAPVISSLTAGKTSITVNFTAPTNNGGASITNYAYTVDGKTWITLNPAMTSSPIVITGLTSYKTYSVKIRAINSAGQGAISGAKSAKTLK